MTDRLTGLAPVTGAIAGPMADMTIFNGVAHAADDETRSLISKLAWRVTAVMPRQEVLRQWCLRADTLYYPERLTQGGADLWPDDTTAKTAGRSHVSVNLPPVYVDVPAALQAEEPIENMLATDTTKEARDSAAHFKRLYCVVPGTRILTDDLRWVKAEELREGDGLWAFDEDHPKASGRWRSWAKGRVTYTGLASADTVRVILRSGVVLTSTKDHRWLTAGGKNGNAVWTEAQNLVPGVTIRRYVETWAVDETRDAGWIAGFLAGEGSVGLSGRRTHRSRLNDLQYAQKPGAVLDRAWDILERAGWSQSLHLGKSGVAQVHINGACAEIAKFLGRYRPERLLPKFQGGALRAVLVDEVVSVEDAGYQEVVTLTSSTGTYFAEGYAAHNTSWKQDEDFDLKFHKACTVKGLYGLTAGRVYWDPDDKKPCMKVIEQPRNLYLGFKNDDYEALEWAAYVTRYEPNALVEEFGVNVVPFMQANGYTVPLVQHASPENGPTRSWLTMGDARIEVWDYWYRKPVWRGPTLVRMDTYNLIIAGNLIIRGPLVYKEYGGELPYVVLYNTFVPGLPQGRPDLYDVEQLIREKYERITSGSQMIANAVGGDYWQLVGPDAPINVKAGFKPIRNEIIAPGPGNRVETITPYVAQFQLEQYHGRIDREMAAVSGLNDLLLGLAPAQVLSSSKAINALIANYESRISIRRKLLYKWRREIWELVVKVWAAKDKTVKTIIANGGGFLDIIDPSLSPRDEQETAVRAANLVSAKLWSQRRGMDAVGVDDPETEQDMIREERTDATLFPADVEVMAQLLGALQSLGLQTPNNVQQQAQGQMTSGQTALRAALGAATPATDQGAGGPGGAPEMQGQTPPIPGLPPEAGGAPPPFAQGPAAGPGDATKLQTMIQGGQVKGRLLTQRTLGRRG